LYSVYDWGASLGSWGGSWRRNRSDVVGFAGDTPHFIKAVEGNRIEWGYLGKNEDDITSGVTVSDVRWLYPYLSRITSDDLHAGLAASGATPRQVACWTASLEERIRQLEQVADCGNAARQAAPATAPANPHAPRRGGAR
jgi:hypothetical protein